MSPAHGTLIKISNRMHVCVPAGSLRRQGPRTPRALRFSPVLCCQPQEGAGDALPHELSPVQLGSEMALPQERRAGGGSLAEALP